jgi:hypothetical protein
MRMLVPTLMLVLMPMLILMLVPMIVMRMMLMLVPMMMLMLAPMLLMPMRLLNVGADAAVAPPTTSPLPLTLPSLPPSLPLRSLPLSSQVVQWYEAAAERAYRTLSDALQERTDTGKEVRGWVLGRGSRWVGGWVDD